jgi:hypothetical protein
MTNRSLSRTHSLLIVAVIAIYGMIGLRISGRFKAKSSEMSGYTPQYMPDTIKSLQYKVDPSKVRNPFRKGLEVIPQPMSVIDTTIKQATAPTEPVPTAPDSIASTLASGAYYGLLKDPNRKIGIFRLKQALVNIKANESYHTATLMKIDADSATFFYKGQYITLKK